MRKCLSPFFIGREEPGLDKNTVLFDKVISQDHGYAPGSKNAICAINQSIGDFVAETLAIGQQPMMLSGDCLSAIGCLAGVQKSLIHPYLLWFDAHGDFHTPETTISGHLGGMPLAMICGRGDLSLMTELHMEPIPESKIYFVGGRDLERGEKEALEQSGIHMCDRIIDILHELPPKGDFWIHFDTDYINPVDAPAMRYPATDGPSARDIKSDLHNVSNSINILGLSISAWAPHLDVDNRTAGVCMNVISPLLY